MIIGTAGHIDHGKTALIRALTGIDADRLAEEKARGITIDLGFAYADLGDGAVTGFVDVPGHERLIHTMLAGAGGIDFALLVVAADDGVMPQTREHLALLDLLGVRRGIVALTKADLADDTRLAQVRADIQALLAGSTLSGAPVMVVSSQTGQGVAALSAALRQAEAETHARTTDAPFILSVDRSFTLSGAGTVVTGMVLSGRVAVGDTVTISPTGLTARVRSVHAQNHKAAAGLAGQRCALNLTGEGVTRDAIHRGDRIVAPVLHAPTDRIDAELQVLEAEPKALGTWFPARLHCHAAEVGARIVPLTDPIAPGTAGLVQLVLDRPIAARAGERFILRDVSQTRTIGGGQFLDLRAPARKRRTAERLAALAAARLADAPARLHALAAVVPVDRAAFARDQGLWDVPPGDGLETIGPMVLAAPMLAAMRAEVAATLETFHTENPDLPGIGRERLRLLTKPRLPKDAFLTFLKAEAEAGRAVLDGAFVHAPGHAVQLSDADEALFTRILPQLLGAGRFRPPRVRDFANEFGIDEREIRRVMKLTQRLGRTDQIARDHFFARAVTQEMVSIVQDLAAQGDDGCFTAPQFRDRTQNGRKVAIEILDYFDRFGLTLRRGDLRRLNPHRQDLFG